MVYAGFWRRYIASFIDGLILLVPSAILGGLGSFSIAFGANVFIGIIYKPVFESSALMGTPGKALMGLVVVSEDGHGPISFKSAIIRYFSAMLSAVILYIGYLMQPFTSKRQTLHDMIAETLVLKKETPDLNYFIVWRDQIKSIVAKL